jgi:hypothetical protein
MDLTGLFKKLIYPNLAMSKVWLLLQIKELLTNPKPDLHSGHIIGCTLALAFRNVFFIVSSFKNQTVDIKALE